MALGQLVVRLGLDAAEFVRGMTKAEVKAQQFRKNLESQVASARAVAVGFAAIGVAAAAAFAAVDRLVKNAAQFKDIEERAGGTAESFASIAVAAATAGVGMADVESASIKLTKAISGLDEESKAAVKALGAIGIEFEAFKRLDPVSQMVAVAKALNGFADGAGKTAVAVALFGKAGAQQLTLLKELAQEGSRQVILTQAQIEAADKYADAQARAGAQIKLFAQSMAIEALPAISAFTGVLVSLIRGITGVDDVSKALATNNAIALFAENAARGIGVLITGVQILSRGLDQVGVAVIGLGANLNRLAQGDIKGAAQVLRESFAEIQRIGNQPVFSGQLEQALGQQRAIAKGMALISKDNEDRMDRLARKPGINFAPSVTGAKALKEQLSDVDKFLQLMSDQQFALNFGFDEKTISDLQLLQKAVAQGLDPVRAAEFRDAIISVDSSMKRLRDTRKEHEELNSRALQDSEGLVQGLLDEGRAIGLAGAKLASFNESLKTRELLSRNAGASEAVKAEIVAQGKFREELAAINHARNEAVDAAKRGIEAGKNLVKSYQDELGALGKVGIELDHYLISLERARALVGVLDDAERERINALFDTAAALATVVDAQRTFVEDARQLNDEFKSSFADNIAAVADGTKSFKDAMKDMVKSWVKALNDMAAKKLGEALFGGAGSMGGGLLPDFAKMFAGLLGDKKDTKTQPDSSASLAAIATASTSTGVELAALTAATSSSAAGLTALTTATTSTSAALSTAATSTSAGFTAINAAATATATPLSLLATNAGLAASALLQISNSSAVGNLFGGGGAGTDWTFGFAGGGMPPINQPSWVGERGPEIFVPRVAGTIVPNSNITTRGDTINMPITVNVPAGTSRQSATQVAAEVGRRVQYALQRKR